MKSNVTMKTTFLIHFPPYGGKQVIELNTLQKQMIFIFSISLDIHDATC